MNFECPKCGYDTAYYDYYQECYVCPECGYEWKDNNDERDDENDNDDEDDDDY